MESALVPDWEKGLSLSSNEDEALYWISIEEFKNESDEELLTKGEIAAKILEDLDHIENLNDLIKEGIIKANLKY